MTFTPAARGLQGDYVPGRGDITGKQFISRADEKLAHDQALRNTRNALQDEPSVLVTVTGGRIFAVPAEVHRAIVAATEAQVAQAQTQAGAR